MRSTFLDNSLRWPFFFPDLEMGPKVRPKNFYGVSFSEYCMRSRIIFHHITSEYNSTFIILVLRLQFSIL